ncbi:MAG TPA: FecR family protein [Candidatus Methylomirabilis sp.]|nr:FecR family protein [Candidatus Methylomirabilis sp.]
MTSSTVSRAVLSFSLLAFFSGIHPAAANASHARVIRLSVVEGDVRFTREAHGDPLADQKAVWEKAQANLPIRQGYVLATDDGRAEVEFENGATAFLSANTVLDFYDLSLQDGVRTTRLVLRQGSASFYVSPAEGEYFSVTGGDFTVEADAKGSFRMNNFDDGSNIAVLTGRISILHKKDTERLIKGQFLSMKAGDDSQNIGQLPAQDDFDHWVAGRIQSVSTATSASLQYTDSSYYAPGFADLYTYGSWFGCGSYGYGWRPFGVGLGWSPFTMGQWMWDQGFGWTWMSFEPWGWAPYHYGGWLFDASCGGWFYSFPGFYPGFYGGYGVYGGNPRKRYPPRVHPPHPLVYRASTAVFVRQNGKLGVVPMNPLDKPGGTPINLAHGVFTAELTKGAVKAMLPAAGEKWETVKSPARDALSSSLVATSAPARTSRSILEGNGGTRVVSLSRESSIVYDPVEHRFVTTNAAPTEAVRGPERVAEKDVPGALRNEHVIAGSRNIPPPRVPTAPISARVIAPPSRSVPPPPAPRSSGSFGSGGYRGGGGESVGVGGRVSAPSAPASHPSAPASSGGGGKPH